MKIIQKLVISVIAVIVVSGIYVLNTMDNTLLKAVKNDEATITCHFKDGVREVPKEKVKTYSDGVWTFTDGGYSKTCKFKKK